MESFFPKEPIEFTPELAAWMVLIGIIYFIIWRFCKNFPRAVKPLATIWVKDNELRSYSLLQLALAIFWLRTVNESTHPGIQHTVSALKPLGKWLVALLIILFSSGFVLNLVVFAVTSFGAS